MHTISEQAQYFAQIQDYLVVGAVDLFREYGVPVEHSLGAAAVKIEGASVMAVIGYAAKTMRGALVLLTSGDVAVALEPQEIRSGTPNETTLRDVLGEFCNMLIGRIKNQLVSRDVIPLVATPTTIFGYDLQLPIPTSGMSAWHRFAGPVGDIYVRLDATFEMEFALSSAKMGSEAPAREGEMVLF
jgi:CheY-specific phosphatase CheX